MSDLKNRVMDAVKNLKPTEFNAPHIGKIWLRPTPLGTVNTLSDTDTVDKCMPVILDCVCDEDGKKIFSSEDSEWIRENLPIDTCVKIVEKVNEISGGGESDLEVMEKSTKTH